MFTSTVFLSTFAVASQALRIPSSDGPFAVRNGLEKIDFVVRRSAHGVDPLANGSIINTMNTEYLTNVEVAGENFTVVLDTGSSDLWVYAAKNDLTVKNQTNQFVNLTYGSGSAGGTIAYGSVVISNHTIDSQVFLNVNETDSMPIEGILGLGFDGNSAIYNATGNNSADATPLSNIFKQNSSLPNFITLDLNRGPNGEDSIGGAFTIGTYLQNYSDIANAPRNNISPPESEDWSIAVGGINVNGREYNVSQDAVNGNTTAVIDSGTSFAIVPTNLSNFIYQGIPGAKSCPTDSGPFWVVPCLSASNLTFTFSGQEVPVNPLDLTTLVTFMQNKTRYTACVGVYTSASALTTNISSLPFYLLGDIFMRNVYTAFNYGNRSVGTNNSSPANIQFFPKTNQTTTYSDFVSQRNQTIRDLRSKPADPNALSCDTVASFANNL